MQILEIEESREYAIVYPCCFGASEFVGTIRRAESGWIANMKTYTAQHVIHARSLEQCIAMLSPVSDKQHLQSAADCGKIHLSTSREPA